MIVLRIETATISDLPGAYRTCLLTADAGEDATSMYRDPDLPGHVYVGPYLARGTGTQLVVVDEAGHAGYLLSADDTTDFDTWAEAMWWPPLRRRYPRIEDGSRDAGLIDQLYAPERSPAAIVAEYPAHLHIDLQARARGTGLGRALIERLLSDLRERDVIGVHLGVDPANRNAIAFYGYLGFQHAGREPGVTYLARRLAP